MCNALSIMAGCVCFILEFWKLISNLFDGTVLSDRSKRMLYDAGLYSCEDDEDEVEVGVVFFVIELII